VAAALSASSARSQTAQLLRPLDDSLVLSDPNLVDHNFGEFPFILAWANYPYYGARSYLKFDLSAIPAGEVVTLARLNLFQFEGGGYASGLDVIRVADDTWSEGTITWNDQPVLVPEAKDLIAENPALTGGERGWVSFDLLASGVWDPSIDLAQSDGKLSLIIRISGGEVSTQRSHQFCSGEAGELDCLIGGELGPVGGRAAQLVIATPEPALGATMGAGFAALGLAGVSRSARKPQKDRRSGEGNHPKLWSGMRSTTRIA
jgi:hypothetical protein